MLNPTSTYLYRYTLTDAYVFMDGHLACHIVFVENSSVSTVLTSLYKNKEHLLSMYYMFAKQLNNVFALATN